MKPAYNKPSVIFEGVIRCSCHLNPGDKTFFFFLTDSVLKRSRQASNEKVKRSSSSVATQSVKRLKGKFRLKSYNAIVLQRHRNPALFQNFPPFSFFPLKNNFIKPACNKPFVIFEGVIRCSCHFNLGD